MCSAYVALRKIYVESTIRAEKLTASVNAHLYLNLKSSDETS